MSRRLIAAAALAAAVALPSSALAATASPKGKGCDRLDDAACLLPFPNNAFTKADKNTATGRRLDLRASQTPRNKAGKPIDPSYLNAFDGFSPGSVILAKVPGLGTPAALARTKAVSLRDLSRYSAKHAPVLVLDAKTGRRQAIWAELDSNASSDAARLLEIHPARNLAEGRRFVVVLRNLKTAGGRLIKAGRRFAALRSGRTHSRRYAAIFKTLRKARVKRDKSLFLAWDFTVASRRSLTERMLHIRDDAFAKLGDHNLADGRIAGAVPKYTLQKAVLTGTDNAKAQRYADVLEGTIEVPCYLDTPGCLPGSKFNLGRNGLPAQLPGNVMPAHFYCVVPKAATATTPARLSLYGHGLLGSDKEVVTNPDIPEMAQEHDFVFCATSWTGMSNQDVPNAITVLSDFSRMPTIADPLQQGMLNALYLGRLMAHPDGLAKNPLLQDKKGGPIVSSGRLYFDGNSQGGIAGGALTAVAPDYTRAALGVPGMNYSVLLPRSSDWTVYSQVMYPSYPDELERPLVLDLAQIAWDRGESDGYAQHMTSRPLPNTPRHTVLMQVAFGDHQVTQYQADVMARTIGARIHTPILAPGRSPQAKPSWRIPAIPGNAPWAGSGIVYWDSGPSVVTTPPLTNQAPATGQDPHEHPRRTPAARQQKSDFLKPDGKVVDVCGGKPCVAAPDVN